MSKLQVIGFVVIILAFAAYIQNANPGQNQRVPIINFFLDDSGPCNGGPSILTLPCPEGTVYISHQCTSDVPALLHSRADETNPNDNIVSPIPSCFCDPTNGTTTFSIKVLCAAPRL